jgi:hypothetical protein
MVNEKMYITVLMVIALIAMVVAVATNDWAILSSGSVKHSQGLWKRCSNVGNNCSKLLPTSDPNFPAGALKAVRVCTIICCATLLMGIADLHLAKQDKHLQTMFPAIAGAFGIIGIIIWMVKLNKIGGTKASPGYSFYLAVSASVMSLIASYSHHKSNIPSKGHSRVASSPKKKSRKKSRR